MELWQQVIAAIIATIIIATPAFLWQFFTKKPQSDSPINAPTIKDPHLEKEPAQPPVAETSNQDNDHEELEDRIEAVFADGRDLTEDQILNRLGVLSYDHEGKKQVQRIIGKMTRNGMLVPSKYGAGIHKVLKGEK